MVIFLAILGESCDLAGNYHHNARHVDSSSGTTTFDLICLILENGRYSTTEWVAQLLFLLIEEVRGRPQFNWYGFSPRV